MQVLLTLPVRMLVIALVAWAAWVVIRPTTSKVEQALVNVNPTQASQAPSRNVSSISAANAPTDWTGKRLLALLSCIGAPLSVYVALEAIRFQRFCKSYEAIKSLGGRIVTSPECENQFLAYVFATSIVDLSETNVSDENCPSFRDIPFLTKVRLCDTQVSIKTIEELSWCPNLVAIDLSGTAVEREQIEPLVKLKNLENLLID